MTSISRIMYSFAMAILLSSSSAFAAFNISPLKLSVSKSSHVDSVELKNTHQVSKTMQVSVLKKMSDGSYKPSNNFVVSPTKFKLLPNNTQLIRVSLRDMKTKPTKNRDDYRVSIKELPDDLTFEKGNNSLVKFVSDLRVPLEVK